ncbi:APC family permease [Sporomusa malonica]|uniref:Amino acid/polyamine/organocation transporter, APC superfamily n=1 Tax=Sporomusa malonica TaxID=112901 RepID=A0A1W2E010_9FIRM|nr:amino acid permease [Sporomusa malonica]SMD03083.1 amino acid/polyamine/organocation transporter, APC superfamily [Sporomusa malonica]
MQQQVELKKSITWVQGAALTIGAVLGSGILVLPAITAEMAGPASLISWLLMGLFSLPMVIAIGTMSSRFPDSGGMATYVRQAFGENASQITGILMLSAMPFGMPVTALVGAHYLGSIFAWSSTGIHLAAAGLLLTAIGLNYRGIELSGRTQVFVVSAILFILTFAVLSAVPQIQFQAFTPFLPHGWVPVGKAMMLLFFAFMGWEMIGHLAEEFRSPHRDLPLSLGVAVVLVNALYLAVAFTTVGSGVYHAENPVTVMVTLVAYRWGEIAGTLIALLGFIVCYCPVHTFIAGFSRLVYAQARDGHFPKRFSRLHPRFQTPHISLLFFAPLYLLILLLSYLLSWDLKPLISIPSANFLVVYMLGMVSAGRILPDKLGKAAAWISALLSGIVFLFAGWFTLFPLAVIMLVYLLTQFRPFFAR